MATQLAGLGVLVLSGRGAPISRTSGAAIGVADFNETNTSKAIALP